MKKGDIVRVSKVPASGLPQESLRIFNLCLGTSFPIETIETDGRIELLVGGVVGKPDYMHSIWLAPDEVQPVE